MTVCQIEASLKAVQHLLFDVANSHFSTIVTCRSVARARNGLKAKIKKPTCQLWERTVKDRFLFVRIAVKCSTETESVLASVVASSHEPSQKVFLSLLLYSAKFKTWLRLSKMRMTSASED